MTTLAATIAKNVLKAVDLDSLTAQDITNEIDLGYGRLSHLQYHGTEMAIVRNDWSKFELSVSHIRGTAVARYGHELGTGHIHLRNEDDIASLVQEILDWGALPELMDDDLFLAHLDHRFPEDMDAVVFPTVAAHLAEKLAEKLGEREAHQVFEEILEKVTPQPADY